LVLTFWFIKRGTYDNVGAICYKTQLRRMNVLSAYWGRASSIKINAQELERELACECLNLRTH